jgi:hypothetical protein
MRIASLISGLPPEQLKLFINCEAQTIALVGRRDLCQTEVRASKYTLNIIRGLRRIELLQKYSLLILSHKGLPASVVETENCEAELIPIWPSS